MIETSSRGKIACVDFNGVLDASTGWRGPDHFGPPAAGARTFLEALSARGLQDLGFVATWIL